LIFGYRISVFILLFYRFIVLFPFSFWSRLFSFLLLTR
jgi:hypothetical protein